MVGFNIRLLGSILGLDILRRLGRTWRSLMFSVHRLNIRVVGCHWIKSRNRVGLIAGSRLRSSLVRVGCLNYIRLGCFFEGKHFVSERLHCLKHGCLEHPHFLSWMLNVLPRDFSSLLSILFCNAVPGVGGTVCDVLMTRIQNGMGR